jgi:hypothetical protein
VERLVYRREHRRLHRSSGILGNWRCLSFWRDHEGIRLVTTNSRKEVGLRFSVHDETEAQEIPICFDESPTSLLIRLGKTDNYFGVDANDIRFELTDNIFAYATMNVVQPVRIKHRAKMSSMKARVQLPLRDNREKIEIRFGD